MHTKIIYNERERVFRLIDTNTGKLLAESENRVTIEKVQQEYEIGSIY